MISNRLLALPLGAVLWAVLVPNNATGEVGFPSASGKSINEASIMGPQSWALEADGCRVGRPGNLVVTPLGGSTQYGGEVLDTKSTGPQLCAWLSMIEKAHYNMEAAWNEEHARRRAQVSRWNLWKRFTMWLRKFPELEILVHTRYLDLWNKDRFGHAMPWITAQFSYKCPDREKTYGLLEHLCGSVFAQGSDPRIPASVHLLLQPRSGFNHPLEVDASSWQYVVGLATGLRGSRSTEEKLHDDGWAWATSVYGSVNSFMTLTGRIDDYWMNQGHCYFKS